MPKLFNILTSPYFIALFISVIVIIPLSHLFISKYKIDLIDTGITEKEDGLVFYDDLDSDGNSEEIIAFTTIRNEAAIRITGVNKLYKQFNLNGIYEDHSDRIMVGDYNNNDLKEIYAFIQRNDSVFISWIEPFVSENITTKYVTTISQRNEQIDYKNKGEGVVDLNNDQYKEVIITVRAGYSRFPRGVFAYDIKNDTIFQSPRSGAYIMAGKFADLDDDGIPEIICSSFSPENIPDSLDYPYKDDKVWLMGFDKNLNFLFEPIGFKESRQSLSVEPFLYKSSPCIVSLYEHYVGPGYRSVLMLFDANGKLIEEKELEAIEDVHYSILSVKRNNITNVFLFNSTGLVSMIDQNFNLTRRRKLPYRFRGKFRPIDIEADATDEVIFITKNRQQLIFTKSDELKRPVYFDLLNQMHRFRFVYSIKRAKEKPPYLFIQNDKNWYLLHFHGNKLYQFRFLFYFVVYTGILLIILFLNMLLKIRERKKQELFRKIASLQIKSINNQVYPHFTFNALNSISSLVLKEDKIRANDYIRKFSALIRNSLMNSDKISLPLKEEVEFVKNYLEIQKMHFQGRLNYLIKVKNEHLLHQKVPKLVIQTHVENAIKHGLRPKKQDGLIEIGIININKYLQISVTDNGIGREAAKKQSKQSTGKGLSIINQIYDLYYQLYGIRISETITDLYDPDGKPAGTHVTIKIPIKQ